MFRTIFILMALIGLTGCSYSPFATSPPKFIGTITPEFERKMAMVEIVWTPTEEIRAALENHIIDSGLGITPPDQGIWYGVSNPYGDRCVIVAAPPENPNDWTRFAILGHELAHCFWGNWHEGGKLPPTQKQRMRAMIETAENDPTFKDAFDRALRDER